jgi:hypothetical protein
VLQEDEKALADDCYRRDVHHFIYPQAFADSAAAQKQVMARHETVNKRLKQFSVLKQEFRHDLAFHATCFYAIANITQISIRNGEPLYEVEI